MKTKDHGFGEGYRGIGVNVENPYTLRLGLNRKSGCVSPIDFSPFLSSLSIQHVGWSFAVT